MTIDNEIFRSKNSLGTSTATTSLGALVHGLESLAAASWAALGACCKGTSMGEPMRRRMARFLRPFPDPLQNPPHHFPPSDRMTRG